MATLKPGNPAPLFELIAQDGSTVRLTDYTGKKLLMYFYPRADTPGCTRQACSVRDARPDLTALGIDVLGISPDKPEKQLSFDTKHNLSFPLLSDPDHVAAEAYGAWGEKTNYGKTSMGIIRSSFLINGDGMIIGAWYKVKPEDTVPRALKALKG